ncbi:TPA_asm: [citrate (pro-3S)-lyase] ligase, partial [Salmonella enterica subsp. enterica serovar Typhi str. CT18]|nr:[citrate (pro-3S)-lyase] ligase [Salmonella enterica subsp. enterica serovar Typhi str. CT18]
RVEKNGTAISASRVRKLYSERNWPAISALVPAGTLAYLQRHAARHTETI